MTTTPHDKALTAFTEYFVRNYPGPDTVIFDPKWHAPKLFTAALQAMKSAGVIPEAGNGDGWYDIASAPTDRQFLAFGHYFYPGDKNPTIYTMIAEVSFGDPEWPYRTSEGTHRRGFFSHWCDLPKLPTIRSNDIGREG